MTPERWADLERIFQKALDAPPDDRETLIAAECRGDSELGREVRALIEQAALAGDRLDEVVQGSAKSFSARQPGVPETVGPYRILEPLGRAEWVPCIAPRVPMACTINMSR